MSRTLVISDIHGGLKALKQVLERGKVTKQDRLIFLGDYVDGWSDSPHVVSFLIELSKTHNCIFIRGNHDDLCHQWLLSKNPKTQWLQHGGQSTIESYESISEKEKQAHIAFFSSLKDYYIDSKNRLYVHAGFQNLHGPEYEYSTIPFYWDRTLWELAIALDKNLTSEDVNYPKRLLHFDEIYIGHTPVTRIGKNKPYKAATVCNVDTGAAFKGSLSMIDADSKEVWQSDAVWTLYPDENGRNR